MALQHRVAGNQDEALTLLKYCKNRSTIFFLFLGSNFDDVAELSFDIPYFCC
uniref:Uncharacterized protein n=1 Tax=Nymphaea colorata TaxID=210225 RepID=A0A5K1HBR0_9MAGN|nr:unnamed protein product [Nymphaea colorata]